MLTETMALQLGTKKTSADDIVGLDIGRSHITAVRLVEEDGALKTLVLGEIGLPRGVVTESGEIAEPEQITAALKALWREHKFRSKTVVVGMTGSALTIAPMLRAKMGEEELDSSVRLEIGSSLTYPVNEAQLSFRTVEEDEEAGLLKLLVIACRAEAARDIVRACKAAGLQVVDIEPEPWVLPRVIDVGRDAPELLLDIGMHSSTVMLVKDGRLQYAHALAMGADHFTRALIDCGYEQTEAEQFKRQHSLIAPDDSDPYPAERAALRACTDQYIDALYAVLSSDVAGEQAARLVLSGGGARLSGLMAYLNSQLGLPVELAEPAEDIEISDPHSFTRTALAYALAMRAHPAWPAPPEEDDVDADGDDTPNLTKENPS